MKNNKNYFSLLALLVVIVALALLAVSLPKRLITRQKAVGFGTVNLLLEATKNTLAVGEEIPVTIKIDNSAQRMISFAEIKLNFNNSLLELVSFSHNAVAFDKGLSISPSDNDANGQDVDLGNTTGQAIIPVYETRQNLPSATSITIGTLIVKGKANGTSPLLIVKADSSVVGQNPDAASDILTLDIGTVSDLSLVVGTFGSCVVCPAGRPTKLQGNADCDTKVDRLDFGFWLTQMISGQIDSQNCADFNGDTIVDRVDFGLWNTGFMDTGIAH